jgi:hypothetical protein
LVVLLAIAYLIVASGFFVRRFVLPRAGSELGATLTARDAAFSPFSRLELWDVKLVAAGPGASAEPIFTAAHVRVRYRLGELLAGRIALEELAVESPALHVVQNADGSGNLDPLLKKAAERAQTQPRAAAQPTATPSLDLKSILITNATLRHLTRTKDGGRESTEISNLTLAVTDLKNGGVGRVVLAGLVRLEQAAAAPAPVHTLRASLNGEFTLGLTPELKLAQAQGRAAFAIERAEGPWAELTGLTARFDADITPDAIRQLQLQFSRGGEPLGVAELRGPFDFGRTEGELFLTLQALDRRVLNLFGAKAGLDFGNTVLNATNTVRVANGGARLAVSGRLLATGFQLARSGATTPALDVRADYDGAFDRAAASLVLNALSVSADQASRPLLRARLSAPMTLAFRDSGANVSDAALDLTLTDLELADWRAFAPERDAAGRVNARAQLLARAAGRELHLTLDADARNLAARFGTQTLSRLDAKLAARGVLADFAQLTLESFQLDLAHQARPALAASGSATAHLTNGIVEAQLSARAALAPLLELFPQSELRIGAGDASFEGRVSVSPEREAMVGRATLAGLEGAFGTAQVRGWDAELQLDFEQRGAEIELRKVAGELRVSGQPAGRLELSGRANPAARAGQLTLRLTGVNERGLRPFVERALGDKQLVSFALDSSLTASLDRTGHAALQGGVQVTNLVVRDPKGAFPSEPLDVRAQLDITAAQSIAQIRQAQLAFSPTSRARNELRLSGTVNYGGGPAVGGSPSGAAARSGANAASTNAPLRLRGQLKLASDALDLTRYYDLFTGGRPAPPSAPAPSPEPLREPEAVTLPFDGLDLEAAVTRLWLRELDAQNVTLTARLERSAVRLPNLRLTLNGAPVQLGANVDLSVPGYRYEVSWDVRGLPLGPLADSFSPAYRGQAQGALFTEARFKGAGITGRNLREHLAGEARIVLTNANVQLVGPKAKAILTPIALVLGAPELLNSPLDFLNAAVRAGNGQIQIVEFLAHSPSFVAQSQGVIPIADVLAQSPLNQDIEVLLARELATRLRFGNVPTNAAYMKLPSFARLRGTLGSPEVKTDKAVILALTATGIGGVIGGKAGGILEGVGAILGGRPAPGPATPSTTNAPAAPPTNAPPPPNPVEDILNLFKRPKR